MSRELLLHRRFFKTNYTIGKLSVDDVVFCDVLEDAVRDLGPHGEGKIPGKTAIPAGRYRVIVTYSPKLKRKLPLLLDVPFFEGIRMHAGRNQYSTEGCPILGDNKTVGEVINGKKYVDELTNWIEMWAKKGEETFITIV